MTDPTRRFADRVEDYHVSRPGYPGELVPLLSRETGLASSWTVVDLGCGTGLSALPFLEAGNRVVGVEPEGGMRAVALQALASFPAFEAREGTAEDTGLPEGCADLVVAAQAFHWFDADRAGPEARRILRPGGWPVVVWNTRLTGATPFMEAYEAFLLEFGTDYRAVRHDRVAPDTLALFLGAPPRVFRLENHQRVQLEGLRARVRSSSYTPPVGHPRHGPMMWALDRLFETHQEEGRVVFLYETEVYLPHR
jgi:SAM-dependent methyltransferase